MPIEEARHKMGAYADALSLDQVVRSPRARALGWTPTLQSVAGNAARLLEEWRGARNWHGVPSQRCTARPRDHGHRKDRYANQSHNRSS